MARWPQSAKRFIPRHPDPADTEMDLWGDKNTLFAVGNNDDDDNVEAVNLRTGEEEEITNPIELVGFLDSKEPLGIGATDEVQERGGEIARAHRRSPKDTFGMLSERSQKQDVARKAETTDDTLLYNLNPTQYDFENFDTPGGAAKDEFDL